MSKSSALVFNIQKFSVHDGPGIRTLVFFKGCPLKCRWCSNPESQSPLPEFAWNATRCLHCGECVKRCCTNAVSLDEQGCPVVNRDLCRPMERCMCELCCPGGAVKIYGQQKTVEQILQVCRQDEMFYSRSGGGLTIGGGEPLFQPEAAIALLSAAKAGRIHTAMETCGHVRREDLLEACRHLDCLYFDIKCMNEERHRAGTGAGTELIHANLEAVREHFPGLYVRVRTPVIPGFNDTEEEIGAITRYVRGLGVSAYELLPYHRYGEQKYLMLGRNVPMGEENLESARFELLREVMEEEWRAAGTVKGR